MSLSRLSRPASRAIASLAGLAAAAAPVAALAHHPLGGETPASLAHGFLSGIGHPMIGFDHFAYVVAVGLVAAFSAARFLPPLAFIGATLAGVGLQLQGVGLPAAEIAIAASVAALGAVALSGARVPALAAIALFGLAGVFHGWAYGEAILGAETTPLLGYLAGLAVVQYAIAAGVVVLARSVWRAAAAADLRPRLAGAVVAGVGLAFLVENVEALIFPGL